VRILLVGLPRSGTSWISNVLAAAPGVRYVYEPDNKESVNEFPFAIVGSRDAGWMPELQPGDRLPSFERLWEVAFTGGWPNDRVTRLADRIAFHPRVPRPLRIAVHTTAATRAARRAPEGTHQLVKTARSFLSTEWIAERCAAEVVVAWRNPLNTISSWQQMGWRGMVMMRARALERFAGTRVWPPPDGSDPTESTAWAVCANLTILLERALNNPGWHIVQHERMCERSEERFAELFGALRLEFSPAVRAELRQVDSDGSGYEPTRVRADEAAVFRRRMGEAQLRRAVAVVESFAAVSDPCAAFSGALVAASPTVGS
jgi:hypothetical protein